MTKTVLYYNRGTKCCLRLLVSLHSLRKVYADNILLILEGPQPEWFMKVISHYDVEYKQVKQTPTKNTLNVKSSLWRHSDYDLTMFMDADTIVLQPIDEYFDLIKEHGFVTGKFADWKSGGKRIWNRIQQWSPVFDKVYLHMAKNYGDAINTGINGWRKNDPFLEQWEQTCAKGAVHKCSDRVADEMAAQLLLHCNDHKLAGVEWGTSVKYGKVDKNTKIIHYHGQKHLLDLPICDHWKNTYHELVAKEVIRPSEVYNDRRLGEWLQTATHSYPLTIVTAVNGAYLNKFYANFTKWMGLKFFQKHPIMIYTTKDCIDDINSHIIAYKNIFDIKVRLINHNYNDKTNVREFMLSTFVFDVARDIKTKYWAKVDCDSTPTGSPILLDKEVFNSTMTGHKWGYTKVKGDPEYIGEHWCHKLDRLCNDISDFEGTKELFKDIPADGLRLGHSRVCTFFAIEKTAWTKHMADICIKHNNGMMLVPSQDTMSWYMITRLGKGRTIRRENFKRLFTP